MKKSGKRLELNKETMRGLSSGELRWAVGGTIVVKEIVILDPNKKILQPINKDGRIITNIFTACQQGCNTDKQWGCG